MGTALRTLGASPISLGATRHQPKAGRRQTTGEIVRGLKWLWLFGTYGCRLAAARRSAARRPKAGIQLPRPWTYRRHTRWRHPRCWCWSQSSRLTCSRNNHIFFFLFPGLLHPASPEELENQEERDGCHRNQCRLRIPPGPADQPQGVHRR